MNEQVPHDNTPRLHTDGSPMPDRRRAGWGEFRHAYPGLVVTMTIALLAMLAADGWLVYKRVKYDREIGRLRSNMSATDRRKADMLGEESENRFRVMVELVRRQAAIDKDLHISVAVDSSMMYLEREGALLREMPVQLGPEKMVGTVPDTVRMVAPRGARTIEKIFGPDDAWEIPRWVYSDRGIAESKERALKGALGPAAILLNGGTVVYAMPNVGPLNDSSYVMPGSVRMRASDLKAMVPNLTPGMKVYFY